MSDPRRHRRWLSLAAPLPALLLGVWVMRRAGVPPVVWGQNLAAGLVLTSVCAFLPPAKTLHAGAFWWNVVILGSLALLAATFLDAGSAGVHRWVQAGPLRVHASAVCLPALILALGGTLRRSGSQGQSGGLVLLIGGATLILLIAQPDAAQATAFAGALLVLLVCSRRPRSVVVPAALAAAAGVAWAWKRPDPLLSVPHVEGIVGLAAQNGALWQVGALLSLALLPLPFLFAAREGGPALALGTYFALCLLGSAVGARSRCR